MNASNNSRSITVWFGRLDNCIAAFDEEYPECAELGVSGVEIAVEVKEAYGMANIIYGVGDIVEDMTGDFLHCGLGAGQATAVAMETVGIFFGAEPYTGISDEDLDASMMACVRTAINAGLGALTIASPAGGLTIMGELMTVAHANCRTNCYNNREPDSPELNSCLNQCNYQTMSEALTIVIMAGTIKALSAGKKPILSSVAHG